jgi:AcrR family transcriptional regulator
VSTLSRIIDNPRKLILEKAERLLVTEGYSRVSIRRVAKNCNIAVGTIYNYFPSKKALIIEMMVNFWTDFFSKTEAVVHADKDFYSKLKIIMDELSYILRRFKEVWLKDELYSTPNYIKSGTQQHNRYISRFIAIIEELIKSDLLDQNKEGDYDYDTEELAKFIVMNLISIIQMPYMSYEFFENVLKKLIS